MNNFFANNFLHRVNDGNANTKCEICSMPAIKTLEQYFWRKSFLYSNVYTKNVKVLTVTDTILFKIFGKKSKD